MEVTIKTIAYVDGQNFLYKIAERVVASGLATNKQEVSSIDIPYLLKQIFPSGQLEIRYYGVAKIRQQRNYGEEIQEKSIQFADNLRRMRNCLAKAGVEFRATGVLKVRDRDECKKCGATDYKFQEKGVDVGLAVDIVADSLRNQVDHIILVSSDTDLVPAIKVAKEASKKITYVGFDNQITRLLSSLADSTQVIRDSEVIEAYRRIFDRQKCEELQK